MFFSKILCECESIIFKIFQRILSFSHKYGDIKSLRRDLKVRTSLKRHLFKLGCSVRGLSHRNTADGTDGTKKYYKRTFSSYNRGHLTELGIDEYLLPSLRNCFSHIWEIRYSNVLCVCFQ